MTTLHIGAIIVAVLSGSYALGALLFGSPLEFGLALALCGVCWVAAHFIEWTVERERAAYRQAILTVRFDPGYRSGHAVFFGGGRCSDRSPDAAGREPVGEQLKESGSPLKGSYT